MSQKNNIALCESEPKTMTEKFESVLEELVREFKEKPVKSGVKYLLYFLAIRWVYRNFVK